MLKEDKERVEYFLEHRWNIGIKSVENFISLHTSDKVREFIKVGDFISHRGNVYKCINIHDKGFDFINGVKNEISTRKAVFLAKEGVYLLKMKEKKHNNLGVSEMKINYGHYRNRDGELVYVYAYEHCDIYGHLAHCVRIGKPYEDYSVDAYSGRYLVGHTNGRDLIERVDNVYAEI